MKDDLTLCRGLSYIIEWEAFVALYVFVSKAEEKGAGRCEYMANRLNEQLLDYKMVD